MLSETELSAMEADADKMKHDLNVAQSVHALASEVRRLRTPVVARPTVEQAQTALAFIDHVAGLDGDIPPAVATAYAKAVTTIDRFLS